MKTAAEEQRERKTFDEWWIEMFRTQPEKGGSGQVMQTIAFQAWLACFDKTRRAVFMTAVLDHYYEEDEPIPDQWTMNHMWEEFQKDPAQYDDWIKV